MLFLLFHIFVFFCFCLYGVITFIDNRLQSFWGAEDNLVSGMLVSFITYQG